MWACRVDILHDMHKYILSSTVFQKLVRHSVPDKRGGHFYYWRWLNVLYWPALATMCGATMWLCMHCITGRSGPRAGAAVERRKGMAWNILWNTTGSTTELVRIPHIPLRLPHHLIPATRSKNTFRPLNDFTCFLPQSYHLVPLHTHHLFIYLVIHSSITSFIHSFIRSFFTSFIYSFILYFI